MISKIFFVCAIVFGLISFADSSQDKASVISPSGIESRLNFKSTVIMPKDLIGQHDLRWFVIEQTKHLLGVFELAEFSKMNGFKLNSDLGVMGLGDVVEATPISQKQLNNGDLEITYSASIKLMALKRILNPGETKTIKIVFPHDPVRFYVRACTDKQWYQKEWLFYFWNVFDPQCVPHLTGQNSVDTVEAEITGLPFPAAISPDYEALRANAKAKGVLNLTVLFGFDSSSKNKKDEGRASYEFFKKYFKTLGFTKNHDHQSGSAPFSDFDRDATDDAPPIHIDMAVSATDINQPISFAREARTAFENSDIVMYIGHSALGGDLRIEKLAALSSDDPDHPTPIHFPNHYQIFYFDSCASFYFYEKQYEDISGRNHPVDIISNGLASYFDTQNREVIHFLDYFIDPKKAQPSWEQILGDTEKHVGKYTYLLNVVPVR